MLKRPSCMHMLRSVPQVVTFFVRIWMKFPNSKTCETLEAEILLPEESVSFVWWKWNYRILRLKETFQVHSYQRQG